MAAVRRVIFAPELCPNACLLFSYTAGLERSFRLRHHGGSGSREIRPEQCAAHLTTDWIRAHCRRERVADRVSFDDAGFWKGRLREYDREWIGEAAERPDLNTDHLPALGPTRTPSLSSAGALRSEFPFLDDDVLLASTKGAKPQDLERMRSSRNSEDYVTWALVCAWKRCRPEWWPSIVRLASNQAPGLDYDLFAGTLPEVRPWLCVRSPAGYERLSRERMAASSDTVLALRARDPRPVEGESEIDLAFLSNRYVVFVEAKLGSDVSHSTKYDPTRNQIVRNIDCALEQAGELPAAMWMFVKDTGPNRMYLSFVNDYRRDPGLLHRLLPHRDRKTVYTMASRLAVITWSDLLNALCLHTDEAEVRSVLNEVRGRL